MRIGNGERKVDKEGLDGVRERMEEARQGKKRQRWEGREEEKTNDETRHSHRRVPA